MRSGRRNVTRRCKEKLPSNQLRERDHSNNKNMNDSQHNNRNEQLDKVEKECQATVPEKRLVDYVTENRAGGLLLELALRVQEFVSQMNEAQQLLDSKGEKLNLKKELISHLENANIIVRNNLSIDANGNDSLLNNGMMAGESDVDDVSSNADNSESSWKLDSSSRFNSTVRQESNDDLLNTSFIMKKSKKETESGESGELSDSWETSLSDYVEEESEESIYGASSEERDLSREDDLSKKDVSLGSETLKSRRSKSVISSSSFADVDEPETMPPEQTQNNEDSVLLLEKWTLDAVPKNIPTAPPPPPADLFTSPRMIIFGADTSRLSMARARSPAPSSVEHPASSPISLASLLCGSVNRTRLSRPSFPSRPSNSMPSGRSSTRSPSITSGRSAESRYCRSSMDLAKQLLTASSTFSTPKQVDESVICLGTPHKPTPPLICLDDTNEEIESSIIEHDEPIDSVRRSLHSTPCRALLPLFTATENTPEFLSARSRLRPTRNAAVEADIRRDLDRTLSRTTTLPEEGQNDETSFE